MVKVPDGITDVHAHIRHENLPDADLVGFAVPGRSSGLSEPPAAKVASIRCFLS
jgi:hypothetical protein